MRMKRKSLIKEPLITELHLGGPGHGYRAILDLSEAYSGKYDEPEEDYNKYLLDVDDNTDVTDYFDVKE